ncbi:MAG: MmcQ/YjbR family DNA-binding protein [Actinomycetes bacterium]
MATWDDVRSIARDLPGAVEDPTGRTTAWRVGGKAFAWERLLRRGEREQLGDAAPDGPALGLRTADPDVVDGLVAARPEVYFTVAGYGVHPMVLVHVERASFEDLDEAITDAWLSRAPKRLREPFLRGG